MLIVKIYLLDKLHSMRDGFLTFMMGTHPRLGEESNVRLLAGQSPVIKLIHDYSDNKRELDKEIKKVDDQIHKLLWSESVM